MFGLCHSFLSATVTDLGPVVLAFTVYEGVIVGLCRMKWGVVSATLAHGGGIFLIGWGPV